MMAQPSEEVRCGAGVQAEEEVVERTAPWGLRRSRMAKSRGGDARGSGRSCGRRGDVGAAFAGKVGRCAGADGAGWVGGGVLISPLV
jgi:hypothetical protein